ncbi:MAG: threonine dehydratase [Acidobacteria bacterium]|nr:MAG: threonine dehydratase [Acidobacteriota bacterium]
MTNSIDRAGIEKTYGVIRPHLRCTPVVEIPASDFGLGDSTLVFKLELMQHSGSFKARGATANLLLRKPGRDGVTAASGGNHGTAVAYAAQRHGAKATIFVPTICSPAKIARIRQYGAELVITGERYADALVECEAFAAQHDVLNIHAFDQPETLLGAGSVGLEFERQSPDLDTVLIAVGGGGLIGGVAAWFAGTNTRVIGVEPELSPTLTDALKAGHPVDAPAGGIAADSLAPKRVGERMFPIAQKHIAEVLLVSDEEIVNAQRALWERLRIVAEPGGAAAFAAILARRYQPKAGERVGVLVCGANTEAVRFT